VVSAVLEDTEPAVADRDVDEDVEVVVDCDVDEEVAPDAVVLEVVVPFAALQAMVPPRPRNAETLSAPASTLDRAAA
jgi:hypothetical protein